MSTILAITSAHNQLRLLATRNGADDHASAHSYIDLFDTEKPSSIDELPAGSACVRITLTKPCGVIVAGQLVMAQQNADGDLIARDSVETGLRWGRWFTAAGLIYGDGDLTDESGDGFFKIKGTSGTRVFGGGRVVLSAIKLD
jgi:hypothetical protein